MHVRQEEVLQPIARNDDPSLSKLHPQIDARKLESRETKDEYRERLLLQYLSLEEKLRNSALAVYIRVRSMCRGLVSIHYLKKKEEI